MRRGAVGALALKDLRILRRSPLLVAILVIYPVALALMIGVALSSPPGRPTVAVYNGVRPGHGAVRLGGSSVNIASYTRDLYASITPLHVASAAAATAAVRDGRASAAIIVPADIIDQVQSLLRTGVGQPAVQLVLNDHNPLQREIVDGEIELRVDQAEAAISRALLTSALGDLRTVVDGGTISFAGYQTALLGLRNAKSIITASLPLLKRAGLGHSLEPALAQVASFAEIAIVGMSFASPVLGQIATPLTVQRTELSGAPAPTSTYAVAIAVTVSELFLALLLAAALLALERSEQVYLRLVRGPASRGGLLLEKVLVSAGAAAFVSLIMSAVVAIFVSLDGGRVELWVLTLLVAALAFAALGVALGALAREVAAASLLAILVGLPVAFLALIPASAVSASLGSVLSAISFVCPFKAGLAAVSAALTGSGGGLAGALVHLIVLAAVYGVIARVGLGRRFAE